MRQFVDTGTGEVFYEEQILRRPDEIVKVFRPTGRSVKFVKIKASQKQNGGSGNCHLLRLVFCLE